MLSTSRTLAAATTVSLALAGTAAAAPGDLDGSFSSDGVDVHQFGSGAKPHSALSAVEVLPDASTIAAGTAGGRALVVRYAPDGTLDPQFGGGDGSVTLAPPESSAHVDHDALAVDGQGRIIFAGWATPGQLTVGRLLADGTLDPSFGSDGWVQLPLGELANPPSIEVASEALGLTVDADSGDILVAGTATTADLGPHHVLVRLQPDGTPDPGFGKDGVVAEQLGTGDVPASEARDVVLEPSGAIVTAGYRTDADGDSEMVAVRHLPDGTFDPAFDGDGVATVSFTGAGTHKGARALALVARDGRIVLGGTALCVAAVSPEDLDPFPFEAPCFAMARLRANGELDTSFGDGGRRTRQVGQAQLGEKPYSEGHDVVMHPSGELTLGGVATTLTGSVQVAHQRWDRDAQHPVSTYGNDGEVLTQVGFGLSPASAGWSLGLVPGDDRLVVAGAAADGGTELRGAVVRYVP